MGWLFFSLFCFLLFFYWVVGFVGVFSSFNGFVCLVEYLCFFFMILFVVESLCVRVWFDTDGNFICLFVGSYLRCYFIYLFIIFITFCGEEKVMVRRR